MRQPLFAACMCSDSYLHLELAGLPLFGKAQTGISGSNAPRTTGFAGKPRIGNRPTTHCVAGNRLEIDINHGRLQYSCTSYSVPLPISLFPTVVRPVTGCTRNLSG